MSRRFTPEQEKILATANDKLANEAMYIEAGKFNQTSDASERREMLQRLIAQSADELEDAGWWDERRQALVPPGRVGVFVCGGSLPHLDGLDERHREPCVVAPVAHHQRRMRSSRYDRNPGALREGRGEVERVRERGRVRSR